jgi:ubiquinone/menaquinone biosynthesis C-methylase UbiE
MQENSPNPPAPSPQNLRFDKKTDIDLFNLVQTCSILSIIPKRPQYKKIKMEYETKYSKYQIHFLGDKPAFIDGLDLDLNNKKVVDLGCGGGINSYYIKEKYPDSRVIPIDISFIRCLKCKDNTQTVPIKADILKIPLKSDSIDFVICTMVIEHVPEDKILVDEMLRILKNGATALVVSVVKSKYAWYFRKNKEGVPVLDSTHIREYESVDEFKKLFINSRIQQVITRKISFSPFRFLYRIAYKLRIIKNADSKAFLINAFLNKLLKFKLGIPGYKEVEILCKKI